MDAPSCAGAGQVFYPRPGGSLSKRKQSQYVSVFLTFLGPLAYRCHSKIYGVSFSVRGPNVLVSDKDGERQCVQFSPANENDRGLSCPAAKGIDKTNRSTLPCMRLDQHSFRPRISVGVWTLEF